MKYRFTETEKRMLSKLPLPFDPTGDLSDDNELALLDTLSDYFGQVAYEPEGDIISDVLHSMAKQAE